MTYLYKEFGLQISDLVILEYLTQRYNFGINKRIFFDADQLVELLPLLRMKKESVIRRVKNIASKTDAFFMSSLSDQEAKDLLCSINRSLENDHGIRTCEWCKIKTYMLEQHHYPIRKKDGGKELVGICPNCHRSFHYLTDFKNFILEVKNEDFFAQVSKNVRWLKLVP